MKHIDQSPSSRKACRPAGRLGLADRVQVVEGEDSGIVPIGEGDVVGVVAHRPHPLNGGRSRLGQRQDREQGRFRCRRFRCRRFRVRRSLVPFQRSAMLFAASRTGTGRPQFSRAVAPPRTVTPLNDDSMVDARNFGGSNV